MFFCSSRIRKHPEREGRKCVRTSDHESFCRKVLWTWLSHYTQEFTVAVINFLRPAWDQVSMDVGGAYKVPFLAKELLAVDCHGGRKSNLSPWLWLPVGCPHFRGYSSMPVHMVRFSWFFFKPMNLEGEWFGEEIQEELRQERGCVWSKHIAYIYDILNI